MTPTVGGRRGHPGRPDAPAPPPRPSDAPAPPPRPAIGRRRPRTHRCRPAATRARAAVVGAAALVATAAGCASGGQDRILVASASSLGDVAEAVADAVEDQHPGSRVEITTGSTAALASQLDAGADIDVLLAADRAVVDPAIASWPVRSGVVDVATNEVVIVVPEGNPGAIAGIEDLAGARVVALCAEAAPCGAYASSALDAAGVVVAESRVSRGTNARTTLTAVAEGGADAGIVYATDAATAPERVDVIAIPAGVAPEVVIVGVALDGGGDPALADAYLATLTGPTGRAILDDAGFEAP